MPPADTYNAQAFPDEVFRSVNKNKDSGVISDAIMLVGHGDGGGGASPAMVESMRRMSDLDGVPRVKFSTPLEFFKQLEELQDDLPRWVGELYFELHRGTYTSQARTKLENRQSEVLLQEAEALCSIALCASKLSHIPFTYPMSELKECWKMVLKNCFHDTLPGSCIAEVYRETARDYQEVRLKGIAAVKRVMKYFEENYVSLFKVESPSKRRKIMATSSDSCTPVNGILVSRERMAYKEESLRPRVIETHLRSDKDLHKLSWQPCEAQKQVSLLEKSGDCDMPRVLLALNTPPRGFGVTIRPIFLSVSSKDLRPVSIVKKERIGRPHGFLLDNGIVRAEICETGVVESVKLVPVDTTTLQRGREALKWRTDASDSISQGGNRLVLYDDVSQFWCAWDAEVYSFEKKEVVGEAVSCEIIESGPLRVALHLKYPATKAGSEIEQFILLRAGSARLDFRTEINWKESRKILRVLFNAEVRNSHASYDSQFGYVKRPTTFNHSWEIAKFEVVGHQFCDLSEPGFGVTLLSDCKYGYSVRDSTMRLSLLRASKSPDDTADMGRHFMTYALLPHQKAFPCQEVFAEAWDLNVPPEFHDCIELDGATQQAYLAFEMMTGASNTLESVCISAVKRSELHSDAVVVRMYETMGSRGLTALHLRILLEM
ncbi:alpha-mannosidase type II manG [Gracilaria domingensis]|nr:alpha-mannosidase type II manG [Gracilaria domingensis]